MFMVLLVFVFMVLLVQFMAVQVLGLRVNLGQQRLPATRRAVEEHALVWGVGFRVKSPGTGIRVHGSGLLVQGSELRVGGLGFSNFCSG